MCRGLSKWTFVINKLWNSALAPHLVVQKRPQYTCLNRRQKRQVPEYVSYEWVGWPPQCQIIDGPACQDVLVWDEVCQVGMWVSMPVTTYRSQTSVPLTLMSAMVKNVDSLPMR
jgi:hypothetical protein